MIADTVSFLKLLPQRWRIQKCILKEIMFFPLWWKLCEYLYFLQSSPEVLWDSLIKMPHGYLLESTEMPHRDNTECCVCQPRLSFILPAAGHLSDNSPQWLYPHGPQQKQLLPPRSRTREGSHMQCMMNTGLQPSTWHSTKGFSSFQNPGKQMVFLGGLYLDFPFLFPSILSSTKRLCLKNSDNNSKIMF